jgi:hypothetical protein
MIVRAFIDPNRTLTIDSCLGHVLSLPRVFFIATALLNLCSEIGSRASSKNASTSSSPNNFEYSAAIAVFSYVQNGPRNERTDRYQQLKHK